MSEVGIDGPQHKKSKPDNTTFSKDMEDPQTKSLNKGKGKALALDADGDVEMSTDLSASNKSDGISDPSSSNTSDGIHNSFTSNESDEARVLVPDSDEEMSSEQPAP